MKRMITLFLAFALVGGAQAQSRKIEEARRVILGQPDDRTVYGDRDSRYPDTYPSGTTRERRINEVNREYDEKIRSVRNNRSLSYAEKQRIIRQLEADRDREIRAINNEYRRTSDRDRDYRRDRKYEDRRDEDNDRDRRRYAKKDNGKHLGWEIGKGNQKKNKKKRN